MRSLRCAAIAAARFTALSMVLAAGPLAHGANLQISPVSISFQPGQNAAGIQLQNNGDTPLYGQVRVYAWDQRNGVDDLTPTTQLVASPPVIEVAPNSTQTIRLVRRPGAQGVAATGAAEQTYRILIDELPRGDSQQGNVAIRLQYSVPAFVLPADGQAAPRLEWSTFQRGGAWHLRAFNAGTLHAQIGATSVRIGARDVELSKGLLGYALPGRAREWALPPDVAAAMPASLAIQATVNTRPQSASAAVARD
ncbi:molecular chaperone [Massilia oculi]|nr:molecular chaperone [Massilia oculi]